VPLGVLLEFTACAVSTIWGCSSQFGLSTQFNFNRFGSFRVAAARRVELHQHLGWTDLRTGMHVTGYWEKL